MSAATRIVLPLDKSWIVKVWILWVDCALGFSVGWTISARYLEFNTKQKAQAMAAKTKLPCVVLETP